MVRALTLSALLATSPGIALSFVSHPSSRHVRPQSNKLGRAEGINTPSSASSSSSSSSALYLSELRAEAVAVAEEVEAAAEGADIQASQQRVNFVPAPLRPSVESGLRYRSDDWLINFLSIPNSFILGRIRFHLLSNTLIAVLVTMLYHRFPTRIGIPMTAHSMLGGFMSLLLVFRTNSAYARFWEGRGMWAKCMTTCRNLSLATCAHMKSHSPKSARKLIKLLAAFPDALVYSCLLGKSPLCDHVKDVLDERYEQHSLEPATALCYQMHEAIHEAAAESPTSGTDNVEAAHLTEASHDINYLIEILTTCRKIARTPVPLSYSRHTSRFLTIWSGTVPFALVKQLGWMTPLVVSVACWCLFGIEEIGHMIEQPFVGRKVTEGYDSCKRTTKTMPYDIGLPVSLFATRQRREVLEIAAFAGM